MEEKQIKNENEHTYDNGFHPKQVVLNENYIFYNRRLSFRIASKIIVFFTRLWLVVPKWWMGLKITGKENKRKVKGALMVSNHIHPLDAFFIVGSMYFTKVYVTMLQSNLGFGLISKYMRLAAAVPIPEQRRLLRKFDQETAQTLDKKQNILFYPEAALMPYCDHIRNFLPGAFHFAVKYDKPILPCCFTFHKPKGILKLFRKKPVVHLHFFEPYFIKQEENRTKTIEQTTENIHKMISDYFIEHSDYYYENGIKKTL